MQWYSPTARVPHWLKLSMTRLWQRLTAENTHLSYLSPFPAFYRMHQTSRRYTSQRIQKPFPLQLCWLCFWCVGTMSGRYHRGWCSVGSWWWDACEVGPKCGSYRLPSGSFYNSSPSDWSPDWRVMKLEHEHVRYSNSMSCVMLPYHDRMSCKTGAIHLVASYFIFALHWVIPSREGQCLSGACFNINFSTVIKICCKYHSYLIHNPMNWSLSSFVVSPTTKFCWNLCQKFCSDLFIRMKLHQNTVSIEFE